MLSSTGLVDIGIENRMAYRPATKYRKSLTKGHLKQSKDSLVIDKSLTRSQNNCLTNCMIARWVNLSHEFEYESARNFLGWISKPPSNRI